MPIDATKPYDDGNVFARILRGELPARKVYEDEHALAFYDLDPKAPTHILVIPTGSYVSWDDFSANAPETEIAGFVRAVGKVARVHQGHLLGDRRPEDAAEGGGRHEGRAHAGKRPREAHLDRGDRPVGRRCQQVPQPLGPMLAR